MREVFQWLVEVVAKGKGDDRIRKASDRFRSVEFVIKSDVGGMRRYGTDRMNLNSLW